MTDAQLVTGLSVLIVAGTFVAALIKSGPNNQLPDAEPLTFDGKVRRKRDAKRFNEHAKLFATFLNNLGIAVIVTAGLAPIVQGTAPYSAFRTLMVLLFAGMLHTFAQLSLRTWKSEE